MILQLKVNPDRQFELDDTGRLTYTLTLKNLGTGKGSGVYVRLPLDPNLELAYTNFSDPRTWVSQIVTDPAGPYVEVRFADFEPNDVTTAELIMKAGPTAQPATVFTRATVFWDDDTASGRKNGSNAVRFSLVEPGQGDSRNDTGGAVQFFTPDAVTVSPTNGKISITGDFYAPDERVDLWYTNKDGVSTSLGFKVADATGTIVFELDVTNLTAGENYVVAGYGQNSGVTGSAVVTVEAGAGGSSAPTVKVRPPTKADLVTYLSKDYRQK
jgi:hypothetical protein